MKIEENYYGRRHGAATRQCAVLPCAGLGKLSMLEQRDCETRWRNEAGGNEKRERECFVCCGVDGGRMDMDVIALDSRWSLFVVVVVFR